MNPTSNPYYLSHGSHDSPEEGRCAMEWVSYLAGEPHSDSPKCVDPVLRRFAISLNDTWNDEQRQKLRPYLARCIGTAGDGRTQERGWLALDWLIRTYTPRLFDLHPELAGYAARLRALSPVMAADVLDEAMVTLREAQQDVLYPHPTDAAAADDRDAAWVSIRDAAGDAARDAAWTAARDDVQAAAMDAALVAAWDASWSAAKDALKPAIASLQRSALDLFDRMLPTEVIQLPVVEDAEQVCGVPLVKAR